MAEKKLYPFKFIPIPSKRVWGGNALMTKLGKTFTVKKTGSGETITRITCGGRRIKGWFVQHEDLAEGKTLQIDTK